MAPISNLNSGRGIYLGFASHPIINIPIIAPFTGGYLPVKVTGGGRRLQRVLQALPSCFP
ncbi:hypothetical protein PanWU01x14_162500 [Parasponia andersonii]|uniref:Uncharacterized protein n=1 Tax=Parasponia andersonii TaxID=3476 RepID=A0A2P5CDN5_PARAD|nr:hypothetical protein PanWU01x14_162500 [Parasponia andersonii]